MSSSSNNPIPPYESFYVGSSLTILLVDTGLSVYSSFFYIGFFSVPCGIILVLPVFLLYKSYISYNVPPNCK